MAGSFSRRFTARLPMLVLVIGWTATIAHAEPDIRNLSARGLQIDGTTTIVIDGEGLGKSPRLMLPFAAKVALKPDATDKRATFEIALGAEVTPGYHQLRLLNGNAMSVPVVIAVDRLPQLSLTPVIEQLPVALHGILAGSAVVETTFQGKAGQKITLEVEAQRLGNKLRPILHLYGPNRLQLGWAWGVSSLHGDARLEATLPTDGNYRITLHDSEYQAPAGSFFRLRIGHWSYVDQVFPAFIGKDKSTVELLGAQNIRAEVPKNGTTHWLPLAWPNNDCWSGPRPFVETTTRTELLEGPSSATPQELPAGSVGVNGRLSTPFEDDRYRIPVTPGAKVRFEVFAERLGSPIDVALVVRNDKGEELTRVEDSPGTLDPALEYTVPANTKSIIVSVLDTQGQGGPRGIYRLTIDPLEGTGDAAVTLTTPERRVSLPIDGRYVFPIWLEKKGAGNPIELTADGFPSGLTAEGMSIPAGAEGTLVSITAGLTPANPTIATLHGRDSKGRQHAVIQKNHPMERLQPWMAEEIGIGGATANGKEFQIDWKSPQDDDAIVPGLAKSLAVTTTRTGPVGPVRLTLLTSQPPILLNNLPDPARNIRMEKAVELPAAAKDGEMRILVPVDLPGQIYDLAVKAELLAADKTTVIATAFAPVRRLPVRLPFSVKLDGPSHFEITLHAKAGATVEVAGSVKRMNGIVSDVQVAITGLPAGASAAPVIVKSKDDSFRLKIAFPATTPAGSIKGLKLTATLSPAPKLTPNQRARIQEIELTLNVGPAK